jgi:PhnB protein
MPVIPHLCVNDGPTAVEFYKKAFGATEVARMPAEDGKRLMHAELSLLGGKLLLHDDFPEYHGGEKHSAKAIGKTPVTLHQEVPDIDAAMAKAAAAGATVTMPAQDMFWGDRYGQLRDPFGHMWSFSTPVKKK